MVDGRPAIHPVRWGTLVAVATVVEASHRHTEPEGVLAVAAADRTRCTLAAVESAGNSAAWEMSGEGGTVAGMPPENVAGSEPGSVQHLLWERGQSSVLFI